MSKNSYDTSLQWFRRCSEFDRDHQAVMLACSHEDWEWRSYSALLQRSGLEEGELRHALRELTLCNVLYMQKNQGTIYFALRERVQRGNGEHHN